MVSMSSPQTVKQAEDYLEIENYYQKNSMLGIFRGESLKHINLQPGVTVDPKIYKTLLKGFNPTTGEKLVRNAGKEDHRAGFDVTFSAPKSVSVLMEYYEGNGQNVKAEMIRKAHELAVKNSMEKLENGSGKTRIRIGNGTQIKVDTDIIYATFQHDTSREIDGNIDPQLHTHNFIFTSTFYTDQKTGEVRSMALSNEEIFKNKMYFGQNYRSELASSLAEMGYKIEVSSRKNGFFEIEGFDRKQLEAFSQRSQLIEEKLPEYREKYPKMQEAQLLQLIVKDTKNAKKEIDRDAVREANLERMEVVGINEVLIKSMENRGEKAAINEELMSVHLDKSLENIIERQSLFSQEELSKMVLKYGLEYGYTEADYMPFMAKNSEIVKLDKNIFSTKTMIKAEKNVILSVHAGREKHTCFTPYESQRLRSFLEEKYPTLTDEQVKMVGFILGNKDQFIAIQGDAGTGKTFAAKVVKHYLETYHDTQEIIGLSFTGKATQGLENDTNIRSKTIHSFLALEAKNENLNESKNRLIIVDEAGMLGSIQMNELIENAKKNGDRIVFMGDTKQFKSISAGNIFNDMQKYGTKTVRLSQAIRFESELTKVATTSLKMEMVKKTLETIKKEGTLQELSHDKQVAAIAENYSNLKRSERKETLIVASTNKDKEAINWTIRTSLGLGGNSYKVKSHANLNGISKHYSEGYEQGLQVSIQGDLEGFKRGQKLYVVGSVDDKTITVKGAGKGAIEQNINVYEYGDKLQVFREVKKPFTKGDVIVFTKNTSLDKKTRSSVKNGERTRIKSISKHGDVVTVKGKKFNINKMPYVDHGYAITDVKSQGSTYKNILIMAKSEMANFNSFYTQITRAKRGIKLFTDNKELLEKNVLKENDFKTSLDYTIKKREKTVAQNHLDKDVSPTKEKKIYKNIHKSKQLEGTPVEFRKGRYGALRKVGVHQTNLESRIKMDIYKNSKGKLKGVSKDRFKAYKKYQGIRTKPKEQAKDEINNIQKVSRPFELNLRKVGVYQSNLDSQMNIDIYKNSRGKLEGVSKGGFKTYKMYQDIKMQPKEKEQLKDGRSNTRVDIQNDRKKINIDRKKINIDRKKINIDREDITEREQPRVSSDKNINVRSRQNHGSTTGTPVKVKSEKVIRRSYNNIEIKSKGITDVRKGTKGTGKRDVNRFIKTRRLARVGALQSNTRDVKRREFTNSKSGMQRLSVRNVVRNEPKVAMLLQVDVHDKLGRKNRVNNGMRRQGDIDRHGSRGRRGLGASKPSFKQYREEKLQRAALKASERASKQGRDKFKSFIKHKKNETKREKDTEVER